MADFDLTPTERSSIDAIVNHYKEHQLEQAQRLSEVLFGLMESRELAPLVHSIKRRAKDPEHLRDKLERKYAKAKKENVSFDITSENLFEKINDLAGVRILHLYTSQFPLINAALTRLLASEEYDVREGPIARVWDGEYQTIFSGYGIATAHNPRLYTSVHYVVGTGSKYVRTAEIQVRTLAEELWGEVDHQINYPHPSPVRSCQEQIKVLARVTSSCTRLVDSIFLSKTEADGKGGDAIEGDGS